MNDYIVQLTLDINCAKNQPVINSAQFDKGRKLEITITSNGNAYDISACTAVLKGVRSNKTHFAIPCEVTNNKILITTDEDTFSARGVTVAKVVLSDSTRTYSTQLFLIDVDNSLEGDITSDNNYSVLNKLIDQVRELQSSGGGTGSGISESQVDEKLKSYVSTTKHSTDLELKEDVLNKVDAFDSNFADENNTLYPTVTAILNYLADNYYDFKEVDALIPADGKSAYQIAVANGYEGTEIEWLESLKGEQGEKGEQGIQGPQGEKGDTGATGADGYSPTASVTQTDTGAVITITDKSGTTTATVSNGSNNTILDYVQTEAERVAKLVLSHQSINSFSLAWLSDMHVGQVYDELDWGTDETSVIEAGQGLYALNKISPVDMIVLGGDLASGVHNTTRDDGLSQMDDCTEYMRPTTFYVPTAYLKGNHDDAPYMATDGRLTKADLFSRLGKKNLQNKAVSDSLNKGCNYGYIDFESQKMRVIFLDTHEKDGWESTRYELGVDTSCPYLDACNISAKQLNWFANVALDFSDKTSVSDWGIIVCSHVSLDFASGTYTDETSGNTYDFNVQNVVKIMEAYLSKGSGSITHNGTTINYDFSTVTDKAYIYCCVHGHNHAHKFSSLGTKGIPSIGCPAVRDAAIRVSDDGNTYTKTAGTAESTSFNIITIDRDNNKIYADNYGAGIDREWDVVIYAEYTNLILTSIDPTSLDPTSTDIYNSIGYKNDTRISDINNYPTLAGYVTTGVMPWFVKSDGTRPTLYIKGATLDTSLSYVRALLISTATGSFYVTNYCNSADSWSTYFAIETLGDQYYKLTPTSTANELSSNIKYIQMSLYGTGDNLIITADEPII